jgi:NAD dependent epimerase/dehydratase family enzyme
MNQAQKNTLEILRAEMREADAILQMACENIETAKRKLARKQEIRRMQLSIKRQLQSRIDEMMAELSQEPTNLEEKI